MTFSEITKSAIEESFANPRSIDSRLVEAQQARRFIDRVVGFMVSPLLWEKVARSISAGRVQSVAVRLLVEREREIRSFVPVEFWTIGAKLKNKKGRLINFELSRVDGKKTFHSKRKGKQALSLKKLRRRNPSRLTR